MVYISSTYMNKFNTKLHEKEIGKKIIISYILITLIVVDKTVNV